MVWLRIDRSEWHTPDAMILTVISPGSGVQNRDVIDEFETVGFVAEQNGCFHGSSPSRARWRRWAWCHRRNDEIECVKIRWPTAFPRDVVSTIEGPSGLGSTRNRFSTESVENRRGHVGRRGGARCHRVPVALGEVGVGVRCARETPAAGSARFRAIRVCTTPGQTQRNVDAGIGEFCPQHLGQPGQCMLHGRIRAQRGGGNETGQ